MAPSTPHIGTEVEDLPLYGAWLLAVAGAALAITSNLGALFIGAPVPNGLGQLWMHRDEGTVLADSARILWGEVPYRDYFNFQGVVFHLLHSVGFAMFGASVMTARILLLTLVGVGGAALATLVTPLFGASVAVGACLTYGAVFFPFWQSAYPHWLAQVEILIALTLFCSPGAWGARGAGFFSGLAIWTIQSAGVPAVAGLALGSVAAWASSGRPEERTRLVHVVLGVAAATLLVFIPFMVLGALGPMLEQMFWWTFTSYGEGQRDAHSYAFDLPAARESQQSLPSWERVSVDAALTTVAYLPYLALGMAVWVGGAQLLRRDVRPSLGVTWAGALVGLPLILGVTRADLVHLAFVGPACLAGVLSGLHDVSSSRPTRRLLTALLCSLGLAAVGSLAAKTARLDLRLAGWEDYVLGLDQSQWLTTHARSDETIVDSTHWAGMSYLLLRRPASPFTFLPGEGEQGYFTAAQWRRLADAIAERRPRAMLLDDYRWGQILRARPDVADLYREDGPGRWRLRDAEEGHPPLVMPTGMRLVD